MKKEEYFLITVLIIALHLSSCAVAARWHCKKMGYSGDEMQVCMEDRIDHYYGYTDWAGDVSRAMVGAGSDGDSTGG